jgi:hypothetical protein
VNNFITFMSAVTLQKIQGFVFGATNDSSQSDENNRERIRRDSSGDLT